MRPQIKYKDPVAREKVSGNMRRLVLRGYITEFAIIALYSLFVVTKWAEDIWMVFDVTFSVLNDYR